MENMENRFPIEKFCETLAMILSEKHGVKITVSSIREKNPTEDKQAVN